MAIIPNNQQIRTIDASVDMKERKSSSINTKSEVYTIADFIETIGGANNLPDSFEAKTYSQLSAMKTAGQLVPNRKYLMTDHQTIHLIPNTVDENTVQDSDTFYARGASQAGASSLTTANLTLAIKNIGEPLGLGFSLGNIDVSAGNNYGKAEIIAGIKANFLDSFHPEGNADLEMFVSVDASDNLNATLKTSTDFDLDLREYIEVAGGGFTLQWDIFETVEAWQPEIEPLILTAISSSEFDTQVQSPLYPQDSIWYDIDNSRWGVLESPNSKGFIYRRVDNDKLIDICQDFRNVRFRRWAVDLSLYTSVVNPYALHDTSVSIGRAYETNSALSLVALDANDYQDYNMFDFDYHIFNNTMQYVAGSVAGEGLVNFVCQKTCEGVDVSYVNNITSIGNIFGMGTVGIWSTNIYIEGVTLSGSYSFVDRNFSTIITASDKTYTDELMVDTTMVYGNEYGRTNKPVIMGRIVYLRNVYLNFLPDSGSQTNFYWNKTHKNWIGTLSLDVYVNGSYYQASFVGLNIPFWTGTVNFTSSAGMDITKMADVNSITKESNLQWEIAVAGTLPCAINSFYAGVLDLTGSGTVTISTVADFSGKNTLLGVKQILKPRTGLTIQIAHNDVSNGFLTNNQTYEANGTNGEYITIEWRGDLDRYIVLSGRTI